MRAGQPWRRYTMWEWIMMKMLGVRTDAEKSEEVSGKKNKYTKLQTTSWKPRCTSTLTSTKCGPSWIQINVAVVWQGCYYKGRYEWYNKIHGHVMSAFMKVSWNLINTQRLNMGISCGTRPTPSTVNIWNTDSILKEKNIKIKDYHPLHTAPFL